MHELGTGVLGWSRGERLTDRYGTVHLLPTPESEENIALVRVQAGSRGKLVAIVRETRKSSHVGDMFREVYPKTPKVGERIVLGEGTLFYEDENVGLQPDDGRDEAWLDVKALYRTHDQTVTLVFEKDSLH